MSLVNKYLIKWIKNSNEMFILRGPFESKKREFIDKFQNIGSNKFLDKDSSVENVESYIADQFKHIFVDIKSLDPNDVKPYIDIAKCNYQMVICPDFTCDHDLDAVKSSKVAKGDENNVKKDGNLSVYFVGWFLSDVDQIHLHKMGRRCLKNLCNINSIREQLEKNTRTMNFKEYFPKQKKRLHLTSKFIGGETDNSYITEVKDSLCSISKVTITGILLTPRTFSCHVRLPEEDRRLFGDKDPSVFKMKPHITLAVGGCNKPVQSGVDQMEVQTLINANVTPKATFETTLGTADDYGECRFYVTLKEEETLSALFNFVY